MAPHRCHICCDVGSPTAGSLTAHYHCCHEANEMCFFCSKQFRTSTELDAHETQDHPKAGRFQCPFCSHETCGLASFWAHVRSDHENEADSKRCDRCFKWFRCADQLLLHNRARLCPNRLAPQVLASVSANGSKRPAQTSSKLIQGSNTVALTEASSPKKKCKRVFRKIYRCTMCSGRPGSEPIYRKLGGHLKNFHNIDPKTHRNFDAFVEQMLVGELDPETGQISYANNKTPLLETIDLATVVDIDDDVEDDVAILEGPVAVNSQPIEREDDPSTSSKTAENLLQLIPTDSMNSMSPNPIEIRPLDQEIRSTETPSPTHSRRSRWDVRPEEIDEKERPETPDYKYVLPPSIVYPTRSSSESTLPSFEFRVNFGQPDQLKQQWIEKVSQLKEMQADLANINQRIQEIIEWGNGNFL